VCAELGLRHEPEIAVNPSGTKRLDSVFGRARRLRPELLCYANCDIVFTKDFRVALGSADWMATLVPHGGRRWDTDVSAPIDFSRRRLGSRIGRLARSEGYQRF